MNANFQMGLSQAKVLESIWQPGITGPEIERHLPERFLARETRETSFMA